MTKNTKHIHGGMEDGIGISPEVDDSSSLKNDIKGPNSESGKILNKDPVTERHFSGNRSK